MMFKYLGVDVAELCKTIPRKCIPIVTSNGVFGLERGGSDTFSG
jgi:hypothetical protein